MEEIGSTLIIEFRILSRCSRRPQALVAPRTRLRPLGVYHEVHGQKGYPVHPVLPEAPLWSVVRRVWGSTKSYHVLTNKRSEKDTWRKEKLEPTSSIQHQMITRWACLEKTGPSWRSWRWEDRKTSVETGRCRYPFVTLTSQCLTIDPQLSTVSMAYCAPWGRNPKWTTTTSSSWPTFLSAVNAVPVPQEESWVTIGLWKNEPNKQGPQDQEQAASLRSGVQVWYLPHFKVYHLRKLDQIRVVFDSSAHVQHWTNVLFVPCVTKAPELSLITLVQRKRSLERNYSAQDNCSLVRQWTRSHHCHLWFKEDSRWWQGEVWQGNKRFCWQKLLRRRWADTERN